MTTTTTPSLAKRIFIGILKVIVIGICILFTSAILYLLLFGADSERKQTGSSAQYEISNAFDDYITNAISNAAEDFIYIKKVYKLNDYNPVAPAPNADAYTTTREPESIEAVLDLVRPRLNGDSFFFSPDTTIFDGSEITYFLDDTIFSITWKEVIDYSVYTFSEVKIEDPSQFRRFLAEGKYGSGRQYLTSQMATSVNAVVASSGDFYKYRPDGIVVYNGNVERFNINGLDTCFVDSNGDLLFASDYDFKDIAALEKYVMDNDIRFSLCFGPVLVEDGESRLPKQYLLGEINGNYARAAICQLGPLHYLLVTVNGEVPYVNFPTLYQLTNTLVQRGIDKAYTLDGGQTATIVMNNKVINQVSYGAERYISDIVYFATALPSKE